MNVSRSLRLIALTLFSAFSVAPSMHGMQSLTDITTQYSKQSNDLKIKTALYALSGVAITTTIARIIYNRYTTTKLYGCNERYPKPSTDIAQLIDDHIDEILITLTGNSEGKHGTIKQIAEFPWLPGYIIKTWLTRLPGAKAFSDCIQKNKLKLIIVPQKWVYTIPNQSTEGLKQLVIAEKLEGTLDGTMNLAQAKELCFLLKNAKYENEYFWDTRPSNLMYCPNGKIGLIDTETQGFGKYPSWRGLAGLLEHRLTNEATDYIREEIKKLD